jgi:hypothetical protein
MNGFMEFVKKLKKILGPYVPKHFVEVYDYRSKKWRRVIYRPIVESFILQMVEALTRSRFGPNISEEQKEYGRRNLFSIDSMPDYVDIVLYAEGGIRFEQSPRSYYPHIHPCQLDGKNGGR